MSIVRVGSNEKYANGWDAAFAKRGGKSAAKTIAKKAPAAKKSAKSVAKKASAGKAKRKK